MIEWDWGRKHLRIEHRRSHTRIQTCTFSASSAWAVPQLKKMQVVSQDVLWATNLTSLIWSYRAQLQFHGCLEQVGHVFFRSLVKDIKASQRYVGKNCALHDFVVHFYNGISISLRKSTGLSIRIRHNSLCCYLDLAIKLNDVDNSPLSESKSSECLTINEVLDFFISIRILQKSPWIFFQLFFKPECLFFIR